MTHEGTIYLDFDCVSHDYQIDSAQSPSLVKYVLELDAGLGDWLFLAADRVYPGEPWSSPGNSMLRRLCGWVLRGEDFPELHNAPDSQRIFEQLHKVRDYMAEAYASRSFERHCYPDFPLAAQQWKEQRYQVISFSATQSKQRQSRILGFAAPDCLVVPIYLRGNDLAINLNRLSSHFPQEPHRSFLIVDAMRYRLAAECRRERIITVLVDRQWVQKPYLESGYGLYVRDLSDFDPENELKREYL